MVFEASAAPIKQQRWPMLGILEQDLPAVWQLPAEGSEDAQELTWRRERSSVA